MKLLAISTSAKDPSAALLMPSGEIVMKKDGSGKPHSVSLMPLIDELLSEAGMEPVDLDGICVDIGPGSFTGVRIGVSAANAMAQVLGKPVYAVCSLAALRHCARSADGLVCCMIDAKNGGCYAALYKGGKCVLEPRACKQDEPFGGFDGESCTVVGDCFGHTVCVDAELVLKEAVLTEPVRSAVPMYLKPSQAERNKPEALRRENKKISR